MKTQVIIFVATLFSLNALFSQNHMGYATNLDTILIMNNSTAVGDDLKEKEMLSARLIDNAKKGRIYFNPQTTLTDARLNVVDEDGLAWFTHSFAVLSDLDISVKRLPQGSYELYVSSDQGQRSLAFQR